MRASSVGPAVFVAVIFFLVSVAAVSAEGIKVGVLLPLSGKLAEFGKIEQRSFIMAARQINSAGGIHGMPVALVIRDTAGNPEAGKAAIEKLISQDKVCIVGGGGSSSVTWAMVSIARKHRIPFVVNTASADRITEKGGDYIFRLNPPVSEYLDPLHSFARKVARAKTVAILYENTRFGVSRMRDFVREVRKWGMRIVARMAYVRGESDFQPVLSDIDQKQPDLFYMISGVPQSDGARIIRQSREMNLRAKLFVGGGLGFTLPDFEKKAGVAANHVFAVTLWTPSVQYPGAGDFYDGYVAKYNEPPDYHGAQAYAAMYVIADALKKAKSHTPHDVRDALAETDILTVFGPVRFISYGKKKLQNKIPVFLGQWLNGRFEAVWPVKQTTVDYIYPLPHRGKTW